MRKVLRVVGGLLAAALTLALVAFVAYAIPNLEQLKSEVPRLDGQAQQTRMDQALDGAISYAQENGGPPEPTGVGKGYALNTPAPEGSGLPPGHWCGARAIGYRIDFTGAQLAGSTVARERARWRLAFQRWSDASGGVYHFQYLGQGTFPVEQQANDGNPISTASMQPGEIAITYAVAPGNGRRWNGYVHPVMTDSLGLGGVVPVQWGPGIHQGLIVNGMVLLDALDTAHDPRELPTPYVHELGHALGLAHVADTGQIMYAHASADSVIQPGDGRGIRKLAALACP